jgi:hypothetical protein
MYHKTYLTVVVEFSESGKIVPLYIKWIDGRKYDIDKVLDVRPAASKVGGTNAIRYDVRILGKQRSLFYEYMVQKWYIETPITY